MTATMTERATGAFLDHALGYAARGIPVFPLTPGSKKPLPGSHGFKEATTNEATIRSWWDANPNANIGLPTGVVFSVLDVDGFEGGEALEEWAEANGGDGCIPFRAVRTGLLRSPRSRHLTPWPRFHPRGDEPRLASACPSAAFARL